MKSFYALICPCLMYFLSMLCCMSTNFIDALLALDVDFSASCFKLLHSCNHIPCCRLYMAREFVPMGLMRFVPGLQLLFLP